MQQKEYVNNKNFRADPHKFAKHLFNPPKSGNPSFSEDVGNTYFAKTYFDSNRSYSYTDHLDFPETSLPQKCLHLEIPSFKEFSLVLRKCKNSPSPGPNGIPHLVWKCCPSLARMLYTLVCRVWSSGKVPSSWQQAIITVIPKSDVLNDPSQFRPIALSYCDGKVFFTLLSK